MDWMQKGAKSPQLEMIQEVREVYNKLVSFQKEG